MTTFLEYFDIPLDQVQGEFLNLDLDRDKKLFIDSYYLTWSKNIYCINALETQKVFMSELMLSLKEGKDRRTNELCAHFKEPKCTGIGLSAASYDGRGSKEIRWCIKKYAKKKQVEF